MADDWEDWEADDYEPQLPATVGQAALAKVSEPDPSKFAGEDEDLNAPPAWQKGVPQPQQVWHSCLIRVIASVAHICLRTCLKASDIAEESGATTCIRG